MAKSSLKPVSEINAVERDSSISDFKRRATKVLHRLREERVPVVITERGQSAAVLVDVETWDGMVYELELLKGIARGEQDIAEGRVMSQAAVKKHFARWLKRRSK